MNSSFKDRMEKLGITPSRSLSQNFLMDGSIADRMIEAANISKKETVLEVGPGLGILTERLEPSAGALILIEKDDDLYEYLKGEFSSENVKIIHGDVLDIALPKFDKVVSNLPFSISSPITFKLLGRDFKSGILTYQKEYADRMIAKYGEKNYSRLSVMVSTHAEVEKLFNIRKDKFYPNPKVDATVLRLIPKEPTFDLKYPEIFSEVVRQLFSYRRKMIRNALNTGFGIEKNKDIPYQNKRVGNLKPEQINEITNYLVEKDFL
ncbi:MAG: 16S rRNA (adenine(1518)-N(6)/adenine(1519)-N(6))-dimethyltransferase RsmA [Candidatus Saliniplasma sp.]